jgi:hypothetical protein
MKKHSFYLITFLLLIISGVSEFALSVTEGQQWSNYSYRWGTQWKRARHTTSLKKEMQPKKVRDKNQHL